MFTLSPSGLAQAIKKSWLGVWGYIGGPTNPNRVGCVL